MKLDRFSSLLRIFPQMERLDTTVRKIVFDGISRWFDEVIEYLLSREGKRLRPLLTLICCRLFSDDSSEKVLEVAGLVEILHSASLLHDDVIDEAVLRRGTASVNFRWGDKVAVLVGDFLLSRLFSHIAQLSDPFILQEFVRNARLLSEGSLLELHSRYDPCITESQYSDIIARKTSSLFSLACTLGSYLGGATSAQIEILEHAGYHIGYAFQVLDDILDYTGDEERTGKELWKDIKQGYFTLPFILGDPQGKEKLEKWRKVPKEEWKSFIQSRQNYIAGRINEGMGIERSRVRAREHIAEALRQIEGIPDSPGRHLFSSFLQILLERSQ